MLPAAVNPAPQTMLGSHIKHVVIIVQENRSFDNIFSGYPGSDSATTGVTSAGTRIPLKAGNLRRSTGHAPQLDVRAHKLGQREDGWV